MSIFDGNILEGANDLLNKGARAVTNAFDSASSQMKQSDLCRQREKACAALGASLFEATRENAELRADREDLFAAVEALDAQIAEVEAAIAAAEAERAAAAAAKAAAAEGGNCPTCGAAYDAGARFCIECGNPIPEPAPEPEPEPAVEPEVELVCGGCGTAVPAGSAFCPSCGEKL